MQILGATRQQADLQYWDPSVQINYCTNFELPEIATKNDCWIFNYNLFQIMRGFPPLLQKKEDHLLFNAI